MTSLFILEGNNTYFRISQQIFFIYFCRLAMVFALNAWFWVHMAGFAVLVSV
jgi:hypothetical protein